MKIFSERFPSAPGSAITRRGRSRDRAHARHPPDPRSAARLRRRPRAARPPGGGRRDPRARRDPPRPHQRRRVRARRAQRREPRGRRRQGARRHRGVRAAARPRGREEGRDRPARGRGHRRRRRAARSADGPAELADGRRPRGPRRDRQRRDPPLGSSAQLRRPPARALPDPGGEGRPRLRGRRPPVGGALRGDERRDDPPASRACPVHARHPRREPRADRGLDARPRPRRGDVRHRPAAEVRRGQLPDDQRLVADPDLRGDADEPRRRPRSSTRRNCRSG